MYFNRHKCLVRHLLWLQCKHSTVQLPLCTHVNNRLWTVLPYSTLHLFLNFFRSQTCREHVYSYVYTLWGCSSALIDSYSLMYSPFGVHFTANINIWDLVIRWCQRRSCCKSPAFIHKALASKSSITFWKFFH